MLDYMGIINLNEREDNIKGLTGHRPLAAVPIAGRYRIIDFALSNLINAGVRNISIFTQNKYRSLMDHVGTGKAWDLDRKNDGLFIMNPMYDYYNLGIYRGDIENFKCHIDYINYSKQNNVIITSSNMICNLDYRDAIKHHNETEADITIVYKKADNCTVDYQYSNTLTLDEYGRVERIDINFGKESQCNVSMEMYIMKKSLFLDIINSCVSTGYCDYFREAVYKYLHKLKIFGYEFEGYLACINSTYSYYKTSMQLLNMDISEELFFKNGLIYTKVKDEPPTKYEANAVVTNSLVANGCVMDGQIENSILFRSVKVRKGAIVRNSIIMQNCLIEEDSKVENAILDKSVRVTKGKKIIGNADNPEVIEKKAVI